MTMIPVPIVDINTIEKYRIAHHAVARMYAAGMSEGMIQRKTGYSHKRLAILTADPTFTALIQYYAKQVNEAFEKNLDVYLDLGMGNMIQAEMQIAEHLDRAEAEGSLLPIGVLDRISQGRADRFGYSKHSTMEVKHDFATLLDRAIDRSGKRNELKQIEGVAVEVPPGTALSQPQSEPESKQVLSHVPVRRPSAPNLSEVVVPRRKIA